MKTPRTSLLITLTGRDRPGVTSRLFGALAGHPLSVLDVEQVVIRGRLVLGVLLGCDEQPDLNRIFEAVQALAADLGLEAEFTMGSGDPASRGGRLHVRALRLIVMDVDSTLIRDKVIDLLAERAGCAAEVAKVTAAAMAGELDFTASLRERVSLLAGLPAGVLDEVRAGLRLTAGARTLIGTLSGLGYKSGIVSGGFIQVIRPLATELGIDYVAANELEIAGGKLTGRLCGPVIDRAGKADALRRFATEAGVPLSQTVAVGDGANDLDMIAAAGLGVAFNAKPVVRDAADTSLSVPYLDAILYLLGISSDDVARGTH